jgi:hypothetical protein
MNTPKQKFLNWIQRLLRAINPPIPDWLFRHELRVIARDMRRLERRCKVYKMFLHARALSDIASDIERQGQSGTGELITTQ